MHGARARSGFVGYRIRVMRRKNVPVQRFTIDVEYMYWPPRSSLAYSSLRGAIISCNKECSYAQECVS